MYTFSATEHAIYIGATMYAYTHTLAHMCVADVAQALAAAPLWRCCFKAQVVPFEVCVSEHTLLAQCRTILWH